MACSAAEVIRIQALFNDTSSAARLDAPPVEAVEVPLEEQDVAPSFAYNKDLHTKSVLDKVRDALAMASKDENEDLGSSDWLQRPFQPSPEPSLETMSRPMPDFHPVRRSIGEVSREKRKPISTTVFLAGRTSPLAQQPR